MHAQSDLGLPSIASERRLPDHQPNKYPALEFREKPAHADIVSPGIKT
jgi:hypothetical protein